MKARSMENWNSLCGKCVNECPESRDGDLDTIFSLERPNPGGSTRQQQVTGFQGDSRGNVGEQLRDGKDEVQRRTVLPQFAVDAGFDGQAGSGVHFIADQRADRTKSVKTLGAGPLAVFLLQIARGYIVGQRVSADRRAPLVFLGF